MPFAPTILSGPAIFDQSIAAFRARKSFSVRIGLSAKLNGVVTAAQYDLSYQAPDKVLLVKLANGRSNLVFWLNGAKFLAYDPIGAEMVVRKAPTSGPIVNRVANSVGGIEDPVAAQLSINTMTAFLEPFRALPDWKTQTANGLIVLTRTAGSGAKKTFTEFDFSASSKLLTRAILNGPSSHLEWDFGYGTPPTNLRFSPPSGTRTVSALSEHLPVATSDPKARKAVDESLRAYARFNLAAFEISSRDGITRAWIDGSSFRQDRAKVSWTYSHGVLTVLDRASGRSYRGKCQIETALNQLKTIGSPIDPLLLALMTHRNPIRGWFLPGMRVTSRGTVNQGRLVLDAIELHSLRLDVSLLIRRDNHLVASVTSRSRDKSGAQIAEASRDFTYFSVNKPLPASTFKPAAPKFLPLSAIGKAKS